MAVVHFPTIAGARKVERFDAPVPHVRIEPASDQLYVLLDASDLRALLEQVEGKPAPSEAERLRTAGQRLYDMLFEGGHIYDDPETMKQRLAAWRAAAGADEPTKPPRWDV
jgi:hypothetical protein